MGLVSGWVGVVAGVELLIVAFGYDRSSQCPLRAVGFHSREEMLLVVGTGGLAGSGLCDGNAEPVDAG